MRKIASLLLLLVAFTSCTEDIQRNNPALQGIKDNVLWRSAGTSAVVTHNGHIIITGSRQLETLILKTNSMSEATYTLGTTQQKNATFIRTNGVEETVYMTGDEGLGDGEIVIEEYDTENMTVTGTFRFNAVNHDGDANDVVNFTSGIFYKIPVVPQEQ